MTGNRWFATVVISLAALQKCGAWIAVPSKISTSLNAESGSQRSCARSSAATSVYNAQKVRTALPLCAVKDSQTAEAAHSLQSSNKDVKEDAVAATKSIVLLAGFENFNVGLYQQVAQQLHVSVCLFF
jgi:hypothetical protein